MAVIWWHSFAQIVLHWRRYHDEMSSHSKAASKPPTQQHDRGPSLPGVIHSCASLLNGYYLKTLVFSAVGFAQDSHRLAHEPPRKAFPSEVAACRQE